MKKVEDFVNHLVYAFVLAIPFWFLSFNYGIKYRSNISIFIFYYIYLKYYSKKSNFFFKKYKILLILLIFSSFFMYLGKNCNYFQKGYGYDCKYIGIKKKYNGLGKKCIGKRTKCYYTYEHKRNLKKEFNCTKIDIYPYGLPYPFSIFMGNNN